MSNNQLINPLLSMGATIIMCALVSACQNIKASDTNVMQNNKSAVKYTSYRQIVGIHLNNNEQFYRVNRKRFTYEQLSDEQKEKMSNLENKRHKQESAIEVDNDRIEQWSKDMERVSKTVKFEAEELKVLLLQIAKKM